MEVYKNLLEMIPKFTIGTQFIQLILFLINFVFAITGTLLVIMAFIVGWANKGYSIFLEIDNFEPVVILIAGGATMLILSLFGGFAAVKQSAVIVNIYGLLLLMLLLVEINVAITTFIIHGSLYAHVEENMFQSLHNQTSWDWDYIMNKWNYMQTHLACCGIHNSRDWKPLHVDGPEIKTYDGRTYTVPYSCCGNFFSDLQSYLHCYDLPSSGCFRIVRRYISNGLSVLGYITLVAILAQLLGLIFTISFSRAIRRIKTEEEMRRQELQHLIYNDLHKPEEEKQILTSSSSDA